MLLGNFMLMAFMLMLLRLRVEADFFMQLLAEVVSAVNCIAGGKGNSFISWASFSFIS
jgi:hypothetical protein